MSYTLTQLTPQVIFIQWHAVATSQVAQQWLTDIEALLKQADQPLYFVSDLRAGHVTDVRTLRQHGDLTYHKNYGGGITLTPDTQARVYVEAADTLGHRGMIQVCSEPSEVIVGLEEMQPGITDGVDLTALLN